MNLDRSTYTLTSKSSLGTIALVVGVIGLIGAGVGATMDSKQFFHSYLLAFVYWLSIGLGALFFTMLHHLVHARWSVVLRRLSESIMITLPMMFLFAIPILIGMHDLYHHWLDPELVAADPILQGKSGFLNAPFFIIRTAFYFAVWSGLSIYLYKISIKQDAGHDDAYYKRLRKASAPGMILFAVTTSFAAIDWMMSLDPHWYSTIFGVYVFSGAFLATLSFMVLIIGYLSRRKILDGIVTVEHRHDVGKLIFAFIIFWTYMAFSQYFLIWYANIPEEVYWFLERWVGSWKTVSLVVIFGHFVLPFIMLIFRAAKRSLLVLSLGSILLLIMRWVDLYWIIMPNIYPEGAVFSWVDFANMIGIGGIFVWFFWSRFTARPIVPVGDPELNASMRHRS